MEGKPSGSGSRRFGYDPTGMIVVEEEAAQLREAVPGLLAGETNLTRIAREWMNAGVVTPTGGRWAKTVLRRLLLRPRIAGLREHEGETYPAVWEGIITAEEHTRLRALYSAPGRAVARRYMLAGIAHCGLCGTRLNARPNADDRRCYVCASDVGGCGGIRILVASLEEFVAGKVNKLA